MPDFSSALYLGMAHPSSALPGWDRLTLGKPAALEEAAGACELGAALARLCGCEAGLVLPSTLHLFWDLFNVLSKGEAVTLLVDGASYPVARLGALRAASSQVPLSVFPHADVAAARRLAGEAASAGRLPVILADGYTPGREVAPPVPSYAAIARQFKGYLVLDDTQPIGVLGQSPSADVPYGTGGGGSLRWFGLQGPHLVLGSSLAKAFGAPLAVLCGSRGLIERFAARSDMRVHASPPSVAVIQAAQHALRQNREQGDALRRRLWSTVKRWRRRMAQLGLVSCGGIFPVQVLRLPAQVDGIALHGRLARLGVKAVLHRAGGTAQLSFILSASHTAADIDRAAAALSACLRMRVDHRNLHWREYGTVRDPAV